MDNFTPEQFERYEAYRRSALPKQSVRKVLLCSLVSSSTRFNVCLDHSTIE
jgi:hTAFII28-like protein conserved region